MEEIVALQATSGKKKSSMMKEKEIMSERWQLNLMTIALAIGIVLVWITWDPKIVICCMALSVLRLGALFYEYPELQIWRDE